MKQAVCLLMGFDYFDQQTYAVISRPENGRLWGMPGGKVEEGETLVEAIIREVKEEMNLDIRAEDIEQIFTHVCDGDVPYETTTFRYVGEEPNMSSAFTEEGAAMGLCTEKELCDPEFSPFHEYNTKLFASIVQ